MALILEDLHWGERSSLLLLEFLAQEMASSPVLLIGTYRDVELNRSHPLGQTLAELNRRQHFLRMTLRGLELEEVGQIIALASGHDPSPELVASMHGQTEGPPVCHRDGEPSYRRGIACRGRCGCRFTPPD